MAQLYRTSEGDRIDLIVLKQYGSLKMLPQVLSENVHLCRESMDLKSGIEITLSDFDDNVTGPGTETVTEQQNSWLN